MEITPALDGTSGFVAPVVPEDHPQRTICPYGFLWLIE